MERKKMLQNCELLRERGGKLRGRKIRERGEKLRGRKKNLSVDLLATHIVIVGVPIKNFMLKTNTIWN